MAELVRLSDSPRDKITALIVATLTEEIFASSSLQLLPPLITFCFILDSGLGGKTALSSNHSDGLES